MPDASRSQSWTRCLNSEELEFHFLLALLLNTEIYSRLQTQGQLIFGRRLARWRWRNLSFASRFRFFSLFSFLSLTGAETGPQDLPLDFGELFPLTPRPQAPSFDREDLYHQTTAAAHACHEPDMGVMRHLQPGENGVFNQLWTFWIHAE